MGLFDRLLGRAPRPEAAARIGIRTGSVTTEVGAPAILHALFSTISANLEPEGWGTRFPTVMGPLYAGRIDPADCPQALAELRAIEAGLRAVPVARIVWDIDDPSKRPHPAYRPNPQATSAADHFVTVNGRDLLRDSLIDSTESAIEFGHDVRIVAFGTPADAPAHNWRS